MNLPYIAARVVRKLTPRFIQKFLLQRSIFIRAGMDTSDPESSVKRYKSHLAEYNVGIEGKTIIVFGFGGTYAVAANLLSFGAKHVALLDLHENLQTKMNLEVAKQFPEYFFIEKGRAIPKNRFISVHHGDIMSKTSDMPNVDITVSNSVMEHVDNLDGIIDSLALFTNPGGVHLHFIHIGDHFGKHPFEMLTYSSFIWRNFLNPPSNLNRLRMNDHVKSYSKIFKEVKTGVILRDVLEFKEEKHRIREEFLSDSDEDDSIIVFSLFASGMKNIP